MFDPASRSPTPVASQKGHDKEQYSNHDNDHDGGGGGGAGRFAYLERCAAVMLETRRFSRLQDLTPLAILDTLLFQALGNDPNAFTVGQRALEHYSKPHLATQWILDGDFRRVKDLLRDGVPVEEEVVRRDIGTRYFFEQDGVELLPDRGCGMEMRMEGQEEEEEEAAGAVRFGMDANGYQTFPGHPDYDWRIEMSFIYGLQIGSHYWQTSYPSQILLCSSGTSVMYKFSYFCPLITDDHELDKYERSRYMKPDLGQAATTSASSPVVDDHVDRSDDDRANSDPAPLNFDSCAKFYSSFTTLDPDMTAKVRDFLESYELRLGYSLSSIQRITLISSTDGERDDGLLVTDLKEPPKLFGKRRQARRNFQAWAVTGRDADWTPNHVGVRAKRHVLFGDFEELSNALRRLRQMYPELPYSSSRLPLPTTSLYFAGDKNAARGPYPPPLTASSSSSHSFPDPRHMSDIDRSPVLRRSIIRVLISQRLLDGVVDHYPPVNLAKLDPSASPRRSPVNNAVGRLDTSLFYPCFADFLNYACLAAEELEVLLEQKIKTSSKQDQEKRDELVSVRSIVRYPSQVPGRYFSFCTGSLQDDSAMRHCEDCHKCTPVGYRHCTECNQCTSPRQDSRCRHCGVTLEDPKRSDSQATGDEVRPEWKLILTAEQLRRYRSEMTGMAEMLGTRPDVVENAIRDWVGDEAEQEESAHRGAAHHHDGTASRWDQHG